MSAFGGESLRESAHDTLIVMELNLPNAVDKCVWPSVSRSCCSALSYIWWQSHAGAVSTSSAIDPDIYLETVHSLLIGAVSTSSSTPKPPLSPLSSEKLLLLQRKQKSATL